MHSVWYLMQVMRIMYSWNWMQCNSWWNYNIKDLCRNQIKTWEVSSNIQKKMLSNPTLLMKPLKFNNTCHTIISSKNRGNQHARHAVYPKKYAHVFCFAVLCCGYTLTDFPISIRLTSLALWQSNDCPSASKATLMNMDKHFMWIHYERLHNHNKAKHNKTVCIFLGIYCILVSVAECVAHCQMLLI